MATRILIRRDTRANWELFDPILAQGELAYNDTEREIRVGDGVSRWSQLLPIIGGQGLNGKSAYEIAVANGFVGSESAWLASLVSTVPGLEGPGVPVGGTLGQVLAKVSNGDFDTVWIDPPAGGGGGPGGGGTVQSVNGKTDVNIVLVPSDIGAAASGHTHTKAQVGLDRVDNTTDSEKPLSIAAVNALDNKIGKAGAGAVRIWPPSTTFPTTGMQNNDLFPKIGP